MQRKRFWIKHWQAGIAVLTMSMCASAANVRECGAKGDGKTNDTAAFAQACTAGGEVYVPAGEYLIDGIALPKGTLFRGVGAASKIILSASGTIALGEACTVADLAFTGVEASDGKAASPQDKAILTVRSVPDVTIRNVSIENYKYTGVYGDHAHGLRVLDSRFEKVNWGVLLSFCHRVQVTGNRVIDAASHGIQFWGNWKWESKQCEDLVFSNNYVRNGGAGAIWGTGGTRVVMTGNIIDGATDVGLDLEWCDDATIVGNTVRRCHNGGISLFFSCRRVSIVGNTIINDVAVPKDEAPGAWWVRSGIWLTYPNREEFKGDSGHRDITIVGNTIFCESGRRRAMWIGSDSQGITIANNTLRNGDVWYGGKHGESASPLVKITGKNTIPYKSRPATTRAAAAE
jgi:hypothetical protein